MDESVQRRAVDAVADALVEAGCELRGTCESPITGTEGNKEFFLWAVRGSSTHRQR
jgi:predicted rRNA methylase YqxC with S4 and FtsJ domains